MKAMTCSVTGAPFEVSDFEEEFCRSLDLPLPTVSPIPRLRGLATFRNRTYLFHTTCGATNRKILTSVPPETGYQIWDRDVFESDRFNPQAAARDYDFSRPFFEQFAEVMRQVPLPNLSVDRLSMENSDFTNGITSAKNCYLIFSSSFNEDCMYSKLLLKCRDVVDCVLAKECELCYGCSAIFGCYNVLFSENSHDCADSAFLANCRSCRNCFGCVNLTQKQYYFFNEPLSKEEYRRRVAELSLSTESGIRETRKRFEQLRSQFPVRAIEGVRNEGSSGQYLTNTKNCRNCYSVTAAEKLEWCIYVNDAFNCLFYFGYGNSSRGIYSSVTVGDSCENVRYSFECWPQTYDLEYCGYLHRGSHDCFGCVGLRKASYCILNKQYSPGEYREMVQRIKKHMRSTGEYGKFFPLEISPQYFNKSEAYDWMPLPKEEALRYGFRWREPDPDESGEAIPVPEDIRSCDDSLLQKSFTCELTHKKFKIQKAELDFHRRMGVALPRITPLERIRRGAEFLEVHPVRTTSCAKCRRRVETAALAGARPLYCEECFSEQMLAG